MGQKSNRLSIERRFIFSIIWVGVIPMALALLIGYFAAREGQQRTVIRNLMTNARKTAAGIRLVVQERERLSARIAHSPEIIDYFRQYNAGTTPAQTTVQERLQHESVTSQELQSFFALYDRSGIPCLWMEGTSRPEPLDLKSVTKFGFVGLTYSDDLGRYTGQILSPVTDPEDGAILGYLGENQSVHDLLGFILETQNRTEDEQLDQYEVIFFSPTVQFTVILGDNDAQNQTPPTVDKVDERLAEKLTKSEGSQEGAFFLWNYTSGGEGRPVLLAYSRLVSYFPVYVAVHLPAWRVFATINIAAFVTLIVSTVIIGIFCLIAYRIINNNILRPISLVNEGAQIIRQGDFSLKLRINTGDEIEELATSFNQMAVTLRNNIRHLKTSEEKYRNLVLSIRDGMFQADAKDRVTFINPAGASILGFAEFDDILERRLGDFFVEEEDYHHIYDALSHSSYVENARVWLNRRDGEKACVELSISRTFDEEGMFIGTAGSFRDVTRNVRLEQEVVERAERIASINQIANVVNSSVEAGLVYENITREVRRMAEFDYAAVALNLNENTFETRQVYPEHRGEQARFPRLDDENSWAGWVAHEKRYLLVEDLETTTLPFRHQFPPSVHSVLCVPLYARNGLIGILAIGSHAIGAFGEHHAHLFEEIAPHLTAAIRNAQLLENLTHSLEEVNLAREKLRQANTELKSLDEMKTELLSNVSHELRTPLVSIMGYTDMLLNNKAGTITDEQREYLDIMMRNTEKLSNLIDNLLDFAKLYHGSEELLPTPFDVIDCIQASIKMVQPVADDKSVALNLHVHDVDHHPVEGPVQIKGDKGKLGQVFNNLLSNAVKFNDNGGTVTVDVSLRNTEATFSVTDTGIGIPKEAQEKIFTRFYQYDSSSKRKYPGTGIGLSIAQNIVRLHGGRISVHSEPGQGATFKFTLPLYTAAKAEAAQAEEELAEARTPIHRLIELVSRDRALVAQVRQVLLSESIDVILAGGPAEACTMAKKYNPDCILLDIESDSTGHSLMETLLQEPLPPAMPLLLLCDDEAFSCVYRDQVAARVKRNFRKSMLLSGIHYALTQQERPKTTQGDLILYVDDDEEAGTFVKRCLSEEGYQVDCCSTGKEALKRLEEGRYWLVLLEIALPDINGWELCRCIRENEHISGIKIYIVTGRASEEHTARTNDTCSDGFLLKPFMAQDILMAVDYLASNRNRT